MRISTSQIYNNLLSGISQQQQIQNKGNAQVSSGTRFQTPAQAGLDYKTSLDIRHAQSGIKGSLEAVSLVDARLNISQTMLSDMNNIMTRAQTLAVQQASSTVNANQRVSASIEVSHLISQFMNDANQRWQGQSLFSGTAVDRPAFVQDTAGVVSYNGNNLNSLYRLMNKLYQRNPREWRKNSLPDAAAAERAIQYAIEHNQDWPTLGGRRDVAALDYSLSPAFQGDRVAAFTYAIGSMLVTAHGGRTEFYLTDSFNAQFIHNAARNLEKAGWMLSQRRDAAGRPLLLSNEFSEQGNNLSYAVEFGKMVARLDLLTHVLEERYRRMGANYAQSLFLLNFLPVQ